MNNGDSCVWDAFRISMEWTFEGNTNSCEEIERERENAPNIDWKGTDGEKDARRIRRKNPYDIKNESHDFFFKWIKIEEKRKKEREVEGEETLKNAYHIFN